MRYVQRMSKYLDYDSRMTIYKTFILSNFNYCPLIWMFTNKTNLIKIEKIQKRALRFICNDFTSTYEELLNKCQVPSIRIMTLRNLAIEVFKCVNELNPKYVNEMISIKNSSYNLRKHLNIERLKMKTSTYGLMSFRSYGPKIWNMLPNNMKISVCLNDFKNIIKTWRGPNCACKMCSSLLMWFDIYKYVKNVYKYTYDILSIHFVYVHDFTDNLFICIA